MLAGASACGAITLTNPVDVVKTRLQLQGELRTTTGRQYTGDLPRVVFYSSGLWYGKNQDIPELDAISFGVGMLQ